MKTKYEDAYEDHANEACYRGSGNYCAHGYVSYKR